MELKPVGRDNTEVTWSTFYTFLEPSIEETLREDSNQRIKTALENLANLAEK
jgi:CRISPR/Cas system CSM-associated protein Csm2 small subunit